MPKKLPPHPMQPLVKDGDGVVRFRPNKIVRFLIDWGRDKGMSLNDIAILPFDAEDREQLAQLIGYSVSGYAELSYVSSKSYAEAKAKSEELLAPRKKRG